MIHPWWLGESPILMGLIQFSFCGIKLTNQEWLLVAASVVKTTSHGMFLEALESTGIRMGVSWEDLPEMFRQKQIQVIGAQTSAQTA